MRVLNIYRKLDEFIKASVEECLENLGVRPVGKKKRRHMKLLGIPSQNLVRSEVMGAFEHSVARNRGLLPRLAK